MKYNFDKTLDHRTDHSYRWVQPEGRNDLIGMGTADMDFECAPAIRNVAQQVCSENTYNYRAKPDHYYDSLTGWYKRMYGLDVSRDWLSNIPATLGAIRFLIGHFARTGEKVIMQTPHFSPLQRAVESAGCELILNPMRIVNDRYEVDLEDFENKVRTQKPSMFILVNPQNPTGRIFTQEELSRMVDICYENNVLILSDEVHSLITYDGKKHIPLLAVSGRAREIGIQVMSMSKGFNTMGLPHAVIMIANAAIQRSWLDYILPFDFYYATNAYALSAFTAVTDGCCDEWLAEAKNYLKANLDLFCREVKKRKIPIRPLPPEAGFLLWIDCRGTGLDPEDLAKAFREQAGIDLVNGLDFGDAGRGFIRMNFAVTRETLLSAIDRLEKMFS